MRLNRNGTLTPLVGDDYERLSVARAIFDRIDVQLAGAKWNPGDVKQHLMHALDLGLGRAGHKLASLISSKQVEGTKHDIRDCILNSLYCAEPCVMSFRVWVNQLIKRGEWGQAEILLNNFPAQDDEKADLYANLLKERGRYLSAYKHLVCYADMSTDASKKALSGIRPFLAVDFENELH